MKNGLTLSMIFEASSLNYGEGMGNISGLKHITRADKRQYSYVSRQALRYSMIEQLGWDTTPTEANGSGEKRVIQFAPTATIQDSPEIDLFGYMKTKKSADTLTRSAVVRLTNAVSLEPYNADLDFLTNMGLARRTGDKNAIAQSEQHHALYAYTITIDLDRIGVDTNDGIELAEAEKAKRVCDFLGCVQYLYRDIRGRRENLAPVFAVGGLYERKTPFFDNRLKLKKKLELDLDMLNAAIESAPEGTMIGYVSGTLENDAAIKQLKQLKPMGEFFDALRSEVKERYAGSQD